VLGRKIDERADEIVARATAKDPEHRHEDVAAFIYELRTFMNMMGIRRRSHDSLLIPNTVTRRINNPSAASEVFELAPMPLASINSDGVIVVGNRAFLEFLGQSKLESDLKLMDTSLPEVYPELAADLERAINGTSVKTILTLSEGGTSEVEVALIMTAPPMEDLHASGEVHLAIHPLARRAKPADSESNDD
jgi:PAS domain-containing protein